MWVRVRPYIDKDLIERLLVDDVQVRTETTGQYFLDSGSSALKLFLSHFGKGKKVGVQAFTCSTVVDAILEVGDKPVVIDININYFTTTIDIIRPIINDMDILVLSHLFGIPNPDYIEIKKLCKENNVVLIDDLCQTFHARVEGEYLENISDNYFYSFFYDKPISCLSGGMLKVEDSLRDEIDRRVQYITRDTEKIGKRRLKALEFLYDLLSPKVYKHEFRIGSVWRYFLMYYPHSWNTKLLNILLNSRLMILFNMIIVRLFGFKKERMHRMSEVETSYVLTMMSGYKHNTSILEEFFHKRNLSLPAYLTDERINCSLAKRAIVKSEEVGDVNDMEIALFNWPVLVSENKEFPVSASILGNYVNIPVWSNKINEII